MSQVQEAMVGVEDVGAAAEARGAGQVVLPHLPVVPQVPDGFFGGLVCVLCFMYVRRHEDSNYTELF